MDRIQANAVAKDLRKAEGWQEVKAHFVSHESGYEVVCFTDGSRTLGKKFFKELNRLPVYYEVSAFSSDSTLIRIY